MGGKPHIYLVFKIYCGVGYCVIFVKLRDAKSSVYKDHCQQLGHGFPTVISGMLLVLGCLSPGSAVLTMCLVFSCPAYFLELDSARCRCGVKEIAKCVQDSLSSSDATIALSWFTCVSDTGEHGKRDCHCLRDSLRGNRRVVVSL